MSKKTKQLSTQSIETLNEVLEDALYSLERTMPLDKDEAESNLEYADRIRKLRKELATII